ncbi:hypothetical protein SCUCBS95973_002887 [Sporothrix curviconia]|uniref:Zn(2)-C6 fungal-type domain-containing protein n=1 Tax=Sporothrix curviconia TaxID=1260050 RepID=A0ABP0BAX4_9PEZI
MAFRRTHRKSRRGCSECKRRRVKCDEQQPQCTTCAQRGSECVYPALPFRTWAHGETAHNASGDAPSSASSPAGLTATPPSTGAASSDHGQDPSVSPALETQVHRARQKARARANGASADAAIPASLDMLQLELMAHWCLTAYRTMARNEQTGQVWRALVPQEALQMPFLMHGILGLSALHLARATPARRAVLLTAAETHQAQSLTQFRSNLSCISAENAKAMFAFAAIVAAYAFGYVLVAEDRDKDTRDTRNTRDAKTIYLDKLLRVLMLSRGVDHVLDNAAQQDLFGSNFGPLFKFPTNPRPSLAPHVQAALAQLRSLVTASGDRQVYHKATESLESMAIRGLGGDASLTLASGWAMQLQQDVLDHLKEYQPLALVLLAHYCVFLHMQREHWCLENWGALVLRDIWRMLDDTWKPHVRWCIMEVQLTDLLPLAET